MASCKRSRRSRERTWSCCAGDARELGPTLKFAPLISGYEIAVTITPATAYQAG